MDHVKIIYGRFNKAVIHKIWSIFKKYVKDILVTGRKIYQLVEWTICKKLLTLTD